MESCLARRLARRRVALVNEEEQNRPRRLERGDERTGNTRIGDTSRWSHFVTVAIEVVDENKSYIFADLLFGFFLFETKFDPSSVSAQTIGGNAGAWDQSALFAEQFGLDER